MTEIQYTPEYQFLTGFQRLLQNAGLDGEHFEKTPKRFLEYLREFNQPFTNEEVLGVRFDKKGHDSLIAQVEIPFVGMCAHHLLPMTGVAHVGYIPQDSIIGLSKMARLVRAVSHAKPSLQEHIGSEIAGRLNHYLMPLGVIVVIEAEHGCMSARGINVPGVLTKTSSLRGVFLDKPEARQEFFSLIR